ncbi:hypothetical protein D3C85_1285700 [compost metagenome]
MRSMSSAKERLVKSFTRRMNSPSLPALAQEHRVAQSSAAHESVSTRSKVLPSTPMDFLKRPPATRPV